MKLKKYLANIYDVAIEENKDADNLNVGISDAARLFVQDCMGEGQGYACLDRFDKRAFADEWGKLTDEEKGTKYTEFDQFRLAHDAELIEAYKAKDRNKIVEISNQ